MRREGAQKTKQNKLALLACKGTPHLEFGAPFGFFICSGLHVLTAGDRVLHTRPDGARHYPGRRPVPHDKATPSHVCASEVTMRGHLSRCASSRGDGNSPEHVRQMQASAH